MTADWTGKSVLVHNSLAIGAVSVFLGDRLSVVLGEVVTAEKAEGRISSDPYPTLGTTLQPGKAEQKDDSNWSQQQTANEPARGASSPEMGQGCGDDGTEEIEKEDRCKH